MCQKVVLAKKLDVSKKNDVAPEVLLVRSFVRLCRNFVKTSFKLKSRLK